MEYSILFLFALCFAFCYTFPSLDTIKKYETNNLAIIEHDTKEYNGQVVNFHSLNAYLAKNGYWIDVHISKVGFTKKDKKTFIKLTESITFE